MAEPRAPRLAVLIDADNASPRIAAGLFEEIAKIGEASVRRIYGDFASTRSKSWSDILARHAINPQHSPPYTVGKNASDIALVIDAMDLLHSGRFDGFCLVSSDSDFTALAARIREQGVDVYGFGEQKTPESFRQACRRFIYTENLLPQAPVPSAPEKPDVRPVPGTQPPAAATPLIRTAISQLEDENGWVRLGRIGHMLANLKSDFDTRNYGKAKLRDLLEATGAFEVQQNAQNVYVRAKPSAAGPPKQTPASAVASSKGTGATAATPAAAKPVASAKPTAGAKPATPRAAPTAVKPSPKSRA